MTVFFNGRLYVTPAVVSAVDETAMLNTNLSVGNVLAVLGSAGGGQPKTPLRFGSAAEARAVLRSGDLLKAVEKAFDPSAETGGPAQVVALRVDPATQATLTLSDAVATPVISLKSDGYGAFANTIGVKIEAGTVRGKKISVSMGADYFVGDNIGRRCLSINYTGAQVSATVAVSSTKIEVFAPGATKVADIPFSEFDTIQKVVDRLNATPDVVASVLDTSGPIASATLDPLASTSILNSARELTSDLQACVDWFNGASEGLLTATRLPAAAGVPVNIPFTFLSSGTDGTSTTQDWQDAFTALQIVDVQWVVPISSNAAIHVMADSHCGYMSNVARMERRAVVGTALATTDEAAITAARALGSDRTSLVHIGFYDYDETGALKLYSPAVLAAVIAAAFSGCNPGTALTNKTLKLRGVERTLRNPTDTDQLILGGVLCVEATTTGFKVVKSISTWTTNSNYNRVEVSVGVATDHVARTVRNALEPLRGAKGSPQTLGQAVSRTDSALRGLAEPEPMGPGVLVGDADNPPFRNIKARLNGDVLRVEFEASPVIPVNYTLIVIHAVPYAGSASAAVAA